MANSVYEGMFILDSNHFGKDPDGVSGKISEMITGAGGEMLVSRLWEERRLAYPIKGHRRGTYWLTYFRLDTNQLAGVERQCQLNDSILRKLFLKVDPRIVEALIAHARTSAPPSVAEDRPEDDTEEATDTSANEDDTDQSEVSEAAEETEF